MAVRENLIELCKKISNGHYTIDEHCAEYENFAQWITDDQIKVMMAMDLLQPAFVENVAADTGFSEEKTRGILSSVSATIRDLSHQLNPLTFEKFGFKFF